MSLAANIPPELSIYLYFIDQLLYPRMTILSPNGLAKLRRRGSRIPAPSTLLIQATTHAPKMCTGARMTYLCEICTRPYARRTRWRWCTRVGSCGGPIMNGPREETAWRCEECRGDGVLETIILVSENHGMVRLQELSREEFRFVNSAR